MKKIVLTILLFCFSYQICSCSLNTDSETINLAGKWKFSPTDNAGYKNTTYNDSSWFEIEVPKRIEQQGFADFHGVGWYRRIIPNIPELSGSMLAIYFSNIADADEVYFNGVLIGKSGSFEKNGSVTPHFSKAYPIPNPLIKTNDSNCIAVRFFKQFGPFTGILNKNPLLGKLQQLQRIVTLDNFLKSYLIFFGSLVTLLLGMYHLILYSRLRDRKDYILFSITCSILSIYVVYLSFIPYAFWSNLKLNTTINVLSAILSVFFLLFFQIRYFNIKRRNFLTTAAIVSLIFCFLALIVKTPNEKLKIFYLYFIFGGILFLTMFFISIKYVLINKIKGNIFIPLGLFVILITSVNDMLVTYGYYYSNLVSAYGFLFFIIGISISLANDFSNTYRAEQLKSRTLENINQTAITLSSELRIDKLLSNSIDILKNHLQVERCSILLINEVGELSENSGYFFGDELRESIFDIGWVIGESDSKPFIMKDVEDTFSGMEDAHKRHHRQLMLVPMIHHQKKVGLIALSKKYIELAFMES